MKGVLASFFIFISCWTFTQCNTQELIKNASKVKSDYGVNSQSKTGMLLSKKDYEMSFIAQKNMDYRISCGTVSTDDGKVFFEIYEMVTQKDAQGNYKKVKNILFESKDFENNTIEFTTDQLRKLLIKVHYDNGKSKIPECIGVLIEDKKTIKIGL
jgi:hypothetical protein